MIWLLRHGDAEDDAPGAGGDAERRLTEKGRRQARGAGKALNALGADLKACLASPKVRALETAELACKALDLEAELDDRLRGGGFDPNDLAAGRGDVLLVGHEPDLSDAIAALTGARVKLRKGGLAALDGRLLHVLVRPKELKEIGR
ncbi:MAG: histidine phosphatase family protein [Solirubrobacterales bacterium]|nr:histidine phosphatase family protein [Solirubrobacterales bacterium]